MKICGIYLGEVGLIIDNKGGNDILKGADCNCGYVCLGISDQTCEHYQNPLSCREYKKARNQNRTRALEHKGQRQLS